MEPIKLKIEKTFTVEQLPEAVASSEVAWGAKTYSEELRKRKNLLRLSVKEIYLTTNKQLWYVARIQSAYGDEEILHRFNWTVSLTNKPARKAEITDGHIIIHPKEYDRDLLRGECLWTTKY